MKIENQINNAVNTLKIALLKLLKKEVLFKSKEL